MVEGGGVDVARDRIHPTPQSVLNYKHTFVMKVSANLYFVEDVCAAHKVR